MSALLLSPLTALHLLCVDLAAAGPLLCIWLRRRELRRNDPLAGVVGRSLAKLCVLSLLGGVVLGFVLLAVHWKLSERWLAAFLAVPRSRLWFGLAEVGFSLLCLAAYWKWWGKIRPLWHHLLALAASLNLLYHFPPLFAAVRTAASASGPVREWSRSDWLAHVFSPAVLARASHFWASSLLVAATAVTVLACRALQTSASQTDNGSATRLVASGGRIALCCALVQIPLGLWLLWESTSAARDRLLFGDPLATVAFCTAMIGLLALLHHLLAISCGDGDIATIRRSALLVLLITLCMVLAGAQSRAEPAAFESSGSSQGACARAAPPL